MKWNSSLLCRSPADEAGAGEAEAATETTETPAGEGEPAPAPEPAGKSSILDFAPKDGDKAKDGDAAAWKLPDGMEIPEHLVGLSAEDTLKKLSNAYKGARTELSTRKKDDGILEGAVPKDIDGYQFTGDLENDPVLKDLTSEESKPIVDEWRKAAMEVGIPDAAFAAFMHKGMANMSAAGFAPAFGDAAEAQRIQGEAEMAALVTELGKSGADQTLRQLDTFAQKLANNGILTDKSDVQEFGQMVGTAKAARIMQRIISAEFGEKAIPMGDGVEGAPTLEEAYEQHNAAMSMPRGADRDEAMRRAEARLSQAMAGGSTSGQLRSRVL